MVPSSVARFSATVLLGTSTVATGLLTYRANRPSAVTLPLLAVSLGGLAAIALVPSLRRAVRVGVVGILMVAVLGAALLSSPPHGADLWVYHLAGRILVEHGESPYIHPPADYPEDPWVQSLFLYRDDPSPFGPAYLGLTAGVAAVGRDSRLAVRLAYQGGAALAVAACFLLLRRAKAPPWSIALLVLNPVLIIEVVGQGRADALLGLALLAAALAARKRPYLAALAIAVAASFKLPMLLALPALGLWTWRRSGMRRAAAVGVTGLIPILVGYAAVGGTVALQPLMDRRSVSNGASIWVLARENGLASVMGDVGATLGPVGSTPTFAALTGALLALVLLLPRVRDREADAVLATPLLAYLLTSTYPTARYWMWVLPVLLLRPREVWATITLALSALILVGNQQFAALYRTRGVDGQADALVILDDRAFRVARSLPVLLGVLAIAIVAVAAVREVRQPALATTGRRDGGPRRPAPRAGHGSRRPPRSGDAPGAP